MTGCIVISGVKRASGATSTNLRVWNDSLKFDMEKVTLRMDIQIRKQHFSGLCILKKTDNKLKGTVINEFGAKAFDFTVDGIECKLLNINSMLDKKPVRKTIEDDLYFLFEADNNTASFYTEEERFEQYSMLIVNYKRKQIVKEPDGTVTLSNLKYGIKYKFRRITEIDRHKIIL
jgi:hypothetical protein